MYGKWFDSAYTGSMAGAGADVFAVMAYAVSHADDGFVELNPVVVASLIGMPVENVNRAIDFLLQPDAKSRNPAEGGRRLVYDTGFSYRVVSQPIYRGLRTAEDRRDYMRAKQKESRGRKSTPPSTAVNHCQPPSTIVNHGQPCQPKYAITEAEADTEAEAEADTEAEPERSFEEEKKEAQRSEDYGANARPKSNPSPAAGLSFLPDQGKKCSAEAHMVAREVMQSIGITSHWVGDQIIQQSKLELSDGASMDMVRDGMVSQYKTYQQCVLDGKTKSTTPMNAQRFFGEGIWKDSRKWGLKKGATATVGELHGTHV